MAGLELEGARQWRPPLGSSRPSFALPWLATPFDPKRSQAPMATWRIVNSAECNAELERQASLHWSPQQLRAAHTLFDAPLRYA